MGDGVTGWQDRLHIDEGKLKHYLLNLDHNEGGPKAKFLIGIGFSPRATGWLANSILEQAKSGTASSLESRFGTKYVVVGDMLAPNGRLYRVQTVWVDENGEDVRLVTLVPRKRYGG
jgi:hypothetical protein